MNRLQMEGRTRGWKRKSTAGEGTMSRQKFNVGKWSGSCSPEILTFFKSLFQGHMVV